MTHEERINYFRIALGMCGIDTNNKSCDLLININDLVKKKKGKCDLISICNILADNNKNYPEQKEQIIKIIVENDSSTIYCDKIFSIGDMIDFPSEIVDFPKWMVTEHKELLKEKCIKITGRVFINNKIVLYAEYC